MGISTVFLDNDGILVDSEKYYYEANREICRKYGHELGSGEYGELFLKSNLGIRHILEPLGFGSEKIERVRAERDEIFISFLKTQDLELPGVGDGLKTLAGRFDLCMVTTAPRACVDIIHARTGYLAFFKMIVTEGDVTQHKPHPEPYLTAMKRMGVQPNRGIAFEDTQRGVQSAAGAGLRCVAIPRPLTASHDFSAASHRADNFTDAVNYCLSEAGL